MVAMATAGFGNFDDLSHDFHCFDGEESCGCFATEHNGVGAINDCVCDVAGFGACWSGVANHGFEHLCGGDDGYAPRVCCVNEAFLDDGYLFGGHFDSEVATSDHDGVGCVEDGGEVVEGGGFFDFCDDWGGGSCGGNAGFDVCDVGGALYEGECDVIDAVREAEGEVVSVFVGECGDADFAVGEVDSLMFAQFSSEEDFGFNGVVGDGAHA